jgi:hypothetical protein
VLLKVAKLITKVGSPVLEKLDPLSSDDGDGSGASVSQFEVTADFDYQDLRAQPLIALVI